MERIQSSSFDKEPSSVHSVVYYIPTLPTFTAQQWASFQRTMSMQSAVWSGTQICQLCLHAREKSGYSQLASYTRNQRVYMQCCNMVPVVMQAGISELSPTTYLSFGCYYILYRGQKA